MLFPKYMNMLIWSHVYDVHPDFFHEICEERMNRSISVLRDTVVSDDVFEIFFGNNRKRSLKKSVLSEKKYVCSIALLLFVDRA